MKKALKIIGIIFLAIIIIIVTAILTGYFYLNSKLSQMKQVNIDENNLSVSTQVEENLTGYRNIALFGVDSRDSDLGKGNRSDCIIIASINNDTKEINLVSVYRDTYVDIDGYGLDKITHAYSYGGPELALKTLNKNLDLNIKEFVTVNFDAVADAVDALGGVDIRIEEDEISAINSAIRNTAKYTGFDAEYVENAGMQTLNGVQAVGYSRVRYTEGGDYRRTERMRTVIEAMFKKLKDKSIGEINSFADKILPEVYTNLEPNEVLSLVPNMLSYKMSESIGWPYKTRGITTDRWYGVPVTLEENVKQLHREIFGEEDYTVSEIVKGINDAIISKIGYTN
jgi:hypothetical protein